MRYEIGFGKELILPMRTYILHLLPAVAMLLLLTLPAIVQAQFTYTITNGTVTITRYTGPGGAVTIPHTINGLPVTAIGGYIDDLGYWIGAFATSFVTSVTIGTNVISIGDREFYECTSLTAITVDALNPAYSSVDGVLFNKTQTT